MRIVIVGPGAMGCLFTALLVESGQDDVWLFDKYESRAKEISKNGLKIEGVSGTRSIPMIKATSDPDGIGRADLVLIFVKSYDTSDASRSILPVVADNTIILTLQNGLNNCEKISEILGEDKVIAGITSYGATMLGVGHIRHAGIGETVIGAIGENVKLQFSQKIRQIADIFSSAGIQTTISQSIYDSIWAKLIVNAAINPITAITRLKNGDLLKYKETRKLMEMTAKEAYSVAEAKGVSLPYNDPVFTAEATCKATASNTSSMLQDILREKPTEIDAINGAIVNEAQKMGIKAPINEVLSYLVKSIEISHKK